MRETIGWSVIVVIVLLKDTFLQFFSFSIFDFTVLLKHICIIVNRMEKNQRSSEVKLNVLFIF